MKITWVKLLGLTLFGLLAPNTLFAQNIGQRFIETIDVKTLNAEVIVVGKIATVTGKPGAVDAVIAVEKTLKGDPQNQHSLHISDYSDSRDLKELFKNGATRILVTGKVFTSLDSKNLTIPTASGVLLRDADKVIEYVQEVLRTHAGVAHVSTFAMPVPHGWNAFAGYGAEPLLVPVDSNLENWAIDTIRSRSPGTDYRHAFDALRKFFKSDKNIAFLKGLLDDSTFSSNPPETNNGIEVRTFDLRRLAFETLKNWGIEVNEPMVRQEIPRFGTLQKLTWQGRPTDNDIEKLVGATELNILKFKASLSDIQYARIGHITSLTHLAIPGITDASLKNLGDLRNLQELDLSMSSVTDKGLTVLAALPNLKRLILADTRISDDGLESLARFPKLESVNLTLTRTSKEGVAQFRSIHPGLSIEQDGSGPYSEHRLALDAFRGDVKAVRQSLDSGWDPNRRYTGADPAIFYAVTQNHYETVKLLLDRKARVDVMDGGKDTPLQWATRYGYIRIMRLLLDRGANVNHMDSDGNTALHLAAKNGTAESVRILLASGANLSIRNGEDLTPPDLARIHRNIASEKELSKFHPATQNFKGPTPK